MVKNMPLKAAMEAVFGECERSLGEKMLNKKGYCQPTTESA
jgi:hypothetical protein